MDALVKNGSMRLMANPYLTTVPELRIKESHRKPFLIEIHENRNS